MVSADERNSSVSGGTDADAVIPGETPVSAFDSGDPDCVNQLRFTVIGVVFLVFGAVPGFYLGKYAFSVLFELIFGKPVETNTYAVSAIAVGSVAGIISAAVLSILAAALLCKVTRGIASLFASKAEDAVTPVKEQFL